MLLSCPKCDQTMTQVHSSSRGVSLDKCTSCSGFWIEKSDLDKLFKKEYNVKFNQFLNPHTFSKTELGCPLCGHKLFEGKTKQNSLEVEFCKTCEGVFVDQGELNELIKIPIDQPILTQSSIDKTNSTNNQTILKSTENQFVKSNIENRNKGKTRLDEFSDILDAVVTTCVYKTPSVKKYFYCKTIS